MGLVDDFNAGNFARMWFERIKLDGGKLLSPTERARRVAAGATIPTIAIASITPVSGQKVADYTYTAGRPMTIQDFSSSTIKQISQPPLQTVTSQPTTMSQPPLVPIFQDNSSYPTVGMDNLAKDVKGIGVEGFISLGILFFLLTSITSIFRRG